MVNASSAAAGLMAGRNASAAGNSGYSRAGVDSIVCNHSCRVDSPASVSAYVVRSGRPCARSVDSTRISPSRRSRSIVW